jgi:dihydroorotate dehydrogenase (NAD+) catalytic subunit
MEENKTTPNLVVDLCGLSLKNPVIAASGTFGFGEEIEPFYDPSILGGFCTKGLTRRPRPGNSGIRLQETRAGLMNSIGLQNPGIEAFVRDILPRIRRFGTAIIANVGGETMEDYVAACYEVSKSSVDMVELNISCPNVKHGGMAFGIDPDVAAKVVRSVKRSCRKPLMVKLSPNAPDIVAVARACEKAGADALSLINTISGLAIDVHARRPVFANVTAGLSGPAIKPIALRMTRDVSKAVSIPVVGMGGIETGEDAAAFIMAGAAPIQVGTAGLVRPDTCQRIIAELLEFMSREDIGSLSEIRGII